MSWPSRPPARGGQRSSASRLIQEALSTVAVEKKKQDKKTNKQQQLFIAATSILQAAVVLHTLSLLSRTLSLSRTHLLTHTHTHADASGSAFTDQHPPPPRSVFFIFSCVPCSPAPTSSPRWRHTRLLSSSPQCCPLPTASIFPPSICIFRSTRSSPFNSGKA